MGMIQEFKTFVARGSVLDLAVGVIIGAAFGKIVESLTDDIIMPVVGKLFGGLNFENYFIQLGEIPAGFKGNPESYADLKTAGVPVIGYGEFITVAVNFLILAWIIFLIVRAANKITAPVDAGPTEVDLLAEIRDELKRRANG